MQSCIYTGHVKHSRSAPVKNAFHRRLFMMFLDLEELNVVFKKRYFWSVDRFNLACFLRKDHFGNPEKSLEQTARELVEKKTGTPPQGPIRMLTHLRYFGHCFNPVTFFYCYDNRGENIETIITEVHNTPWGESYCYVLDQKKNSGTFERQQFQLAKDFHVSPFIDMDVHYEWLFEKPGDLLHIHMKDLKKDKKFFEADLLLEKKELNGPNLAKMLLSYPFMTVSVILAIYWHALRLYVKGAPFYEHTQYKDKMYG